MTAFGPVDIYVGKDEVSRGDVSTVRSILDSFIPTLFERNRNNVTIFINGYDNDERDLYWIPEVRAWFHALFDATPDFFFWMDLNDNRLAYYAFYFTTPEKVPGGTRINPKEMQQFLLWGFERLNSFCTQHGLDAGPSNNHVRSSIHQVWGDKG